MTQKDVHGSFHQNAGPNDEAEKVGGQTTEIPKKMSLSEIFPSETEPHLQ